MAKYVRLIDMTRCMGCRSCVSACAVENYFTPDAPWNVMNEYEVGTYPAVKKVFNTMGCMHCEKPACKAACDYVGAKAISKNEFGAVIIDYDKCIGCGYCAAVCPYGVPQYNAELRPLSPGKDPSVRKTSLTQRATRRIARKPRSSRSALSVRTSSKKAVANGKVDRIGKDQQYTPTCDLVCPTQARLFGDIDDPTSEVAKRIEKTKAVQMLKQYNTSPQVYYVLEEGATS